MSGSLKKAVLRRDAVWVSGWIAARQMLDVPPEAIAPWLDDLAARLESEPLTSDWSDGTCDLFLRSRLTECGYYQAIGVGTCDVRLTVQLHVGFLYLEETDEMLALLRSEENVRATGAPHLATPGIERTLVKIKPIDRITSMVAPVEPPSVRQKLMITPDVEALIEIIEQ